MQKKLIINDHSFPLPVSTAVEYQIDTNSTHIFFDDESQFEPFINGIFEALKIDRFGHNLGIVFSAGHIFWDGRTPPTGIKITAHRPISQALCAPGFPGLIEACQHSEPATRIAERYLRGMERIGPKYWKEMSKWQRQQATRVNKMASCLIAREGYFW